MKTMTFQTQQPGHDTVSDFRSALRRSALRLGVIYWLCMFVADTVLGIFIGIDPLESAPLKLVMFGACALMTYVMSRALLRQRDVTFIRNSTDITTRSW